MADDESPAQQAQSPEEPAATAPAAESAPADASSAAAPLAAAAVATEAPADQTPPATASDAWAEEHAEAGAPHEFPEMASLVPPSPPVSDEVRRILRIGVPVIVKLADKLLPLGDIIDVSPGSIVEFSKSADQPLELLVNNKIIGRGVAVKVGEKFGLRIDEILPVDETIRKLGG